MKPGSLSTPYNWPVISGYGPTNLRTAGSNNLGLSNIERDMFRIHEAILSGHDVFLSRQIDSNIVPSREWPNMGETELTIYVSKAICGGMHQGSKVKLFENDHYLPYIDEPEVVFITTTGNNDVKYYTPSPGALEQYQSFSDEQKRNLELRMKARAEEREIVRRRFAEECGLPLKGQPVNP